jgi:hypothetical protein
LSLLDEAMQQHHSAPIHAKQHAGNPTLRNLAAHFPQALPKRATERHPDRPGELDVLDVLADDFSIGSIESLQPFSDRRAARAIRKRPREAASTVAPSLLYHF